MEQDKKVYKFNDEVIAHMVQLLQIGLLEGTDITDHFRRVKMLTDDSGELFLCEEYQDEFKESLQRMTDFIQEQLDSKGE